MKHIINSYQDVIKDYFYEFHRSLKPGTLNIISFVSIGILSANWVDLENPNYLSGIPIIFALLSATFHQVSLPLMMYLIPYSKAQRETYIQKMLYMKMLIPLCVALIWDFTLLFIKPMSVYAFLLQLISILIITYICGTLNEENANSMESRIAYGSMRNFAVIPLILVYIGGVEMVVVCMEDSISQLDFALVIGAMLLLFLPIIHVISKHWKQIRSNFANYEIATWEVK